MTGVRSRTRRPPGAMGSSSRARCGPTTPARAFLSAVPLAPYWRSDRAAVWVTPARQLVGAHCGLLAFVRRQPDYAGWHSHHVVEHRHLRNLGLAGRLPPYPELPCVLLPASGHLRRLGSILRGLDSVRLTRAQLLVAYAEAYSLLGDYTGGGERAISRELLLVARRLLAGP